VIEHREDIEMSDGLTLSETGAAELSGHDKSELVKMIRETVQRIEDLYRPTRAMIQSSVVSTDPVMLGLYGARDGLMDAERSILGIGLRFPGHSEV
jgi:hypothetical protein